MSNFIAIPFSAGFYLIGTASGTLGQIIDKGKFSDAYVDIERLVGPCTTAPEEKTIEHLAAPCSAMFAKPLRIPGALVTGGRLSTTAELKTALDAALGAAASERKRFIAVAAEAIRRAASIEIDFSAAIEAKASFLGMTKSAGAFVAAHVRVAIWDITGAAGSETVTVMADAAVEFSASTGFQGVDGLPRCASLVVVLRAANATLRLDADDLGLRFPEFALPTFNLLEGLPILALSDGLDNAAASLKQLVADAQVKVEQDPLQIGPPKLVLQARKGTAGIDWLVVSGDYAGELLADTDKIARFTVETSREVAGGVLFSVAGLQLGDVAGRKIFGGTVQASMAPINLDGASPKHLGPFELSWRGMTVTPTHQGNAFGGASPPNEGPTLRARLAFKELTLRLTDDVDTFLTFSGVVEIDPSGVRLIELALVQPYPLALLQRAADDIARAGAGVIHVVTELAGLAQKELNKLMAILGRMAGAVGRAAILVADAAGDAFNGLGDLLASGVAGAGEMLAELFGQLAQLMKMGDAPTADLALEVRIATRPLALQQVLVTLKEPIAEQLLQLLGFRLRIPQQWKPGLLLDFATQPGAYLVLSSGKEAGAPDIATLSTDLWLDQAQQDGKVSSRALRDVDGETPDPAPRQKEQEPLLSLSLQLKKEGTAANQLLVLAGLHRGQPVFFKRLAGETRPVALPGKPGVQARTIDGPLSLIPLDDGFDLGVKLKEDRILPLLGMGASGDAPDATGPSFLQKLQESLSNVVWVKDTKTSASLSTREARIDLILGLKAAGLETTLDLKAFLSLDTLAMRLEASNVFPVSSQRIEEEALGLLWIIEQADEQERAENKSIEMFSIGFAGGQSGFELNTVKSGTEAAGKARMQLRFNDLSSDGQGVVFEVATFKIGPGGLDLVAKVSDNPVRLNGIDVPFHFTEGRLEIKGGRLVSAMIAGRGALPPDLIGEADCTVALTFGEVPGEGIVLQSGKVELDKKNDPIICHAARFTLTISDLDIAFVKDGGYHFYYLVTGSLRFSPKDGEFESGLLQYLDGVEMNLERTPLSADPRVLVKHISFQKTLNPKKSFNLFNLFTFELRGFGYHPAAPKFDGAPAVNISGQIKFVEIGDVMQPSIDFHGLWIAAPKAGESLPRIKADGLGIDLNLKGSVKVRGSVIAVDPDTRTVEGHELAPKDYTAAGFLGNGEFEIPGWGVMGASLGFLELEHKERPGERRKSFFFFANKKKLAIEIPTVVWNFYLREAGFGLGFRYTLDAIARADAAPSIPKLINALDEVSKTQGDLHKFSAWKPEPEGDRVTLALKGALQVYPANKTWDEAAEKAAQNPFMFDLVAAIRSDFTLFMGLRGWVGTNYIDYLEDKDQLRANPGLRGYLYISAPRQRLLARMIGNSKGYIGERIPALAKGAPLRTALQSVDWSATLFIKPGLFHYELGWPDQLAVRLFDEENMRVTVRGGMIFRAADDGLLWGYNIEADAFFRFGGSLQAGPVGVCAEATLTANLVARVLCYLSWRFAGSLIYGLVALDAKLVVTFRAWMEIDLGIKKFTIRIGFSRTLQFSAAIELALSTEGVGARVAARVAVSVFGCTLSVSVGFVLGQGQLDDARARVQRFLAMSITAEEPDAAPVGLSQAGDQRLQQDAACAQATIGAPTAADVTEPNTDPVVKPASQKRSVFGKPMRETAFWCVLHEAGMFEGAPAPDGYGYALLLPQEPRSARRPDDDEETAMLSAFYAPPRFFESLSDKRDAGKAAHRLHLPDSELTSDQLAALHRLRRCDGPMRNFVDFKPTKECPCPVTANWNTPVETDDGSEVLTLARVFDECYLADTEWRDAVPGIGNATPPPYRRTVAWKEPLARVHGRARPVRAGTDQERNAERDSVQRAHAADAAENPIVDAVRQARSSVLSMFAEQFVELARSGDTGSKWAHVADLGLVFYGKLEDLEHLALLLVEKNDLVAKASLKQAGPVEVFNPHVDWFVHNDPVLADDRSRVGPDGVKLDWTLRTAFTTGDGMSAKDDPQQFLQHYEIVRTIEGREFTPCLVTVKPAATLGGRRDDDVGDEHAGATRVHGEVALLAPEWQFTDDLADVEPELRRALLPGSDAAAAREAALWWSANIGQDTLALSYSVTPVDIAGSRGMPKSFLVDIKRPAPPLRPAQAELRFIVTSLGAGGHHGGAMPADALVVVLALGDPSPPTPAGLTITRSYRLIADPENISPSGHYGTDGLSERRPGLASSIGRSADERVWEIKDEHFYPALKKDDSVDPAHRFHELESDPGTLKSFPQWRVLAGKTDHKPPVDTLAGFGQAWPPTLVMDGDVEVAPGTIGIGFLESLWRRNGAAAGRRVATRFWLETVQTVERGGGGPPITVTSQRVPVNVEVRVLPREGYDTGLLRPEAFEWPVHLDLPPHGAGQVRANSGFARFRAPPANGALAELLATGGVGGCALVRDPERRIVTEIDFDAAPAFATVPAFGVDAAHASTIAGFDLHELDLDDLAALDTGGATRIAGNATTWRRARRVARVERVSAEMARLLPDSNQDWTGWQAHYPSETWRLEQRAAGREGQSRPRRAAWYTAAESSVAFAARVPRLRLFPTASEAAVADLLRFGIPDRLVVTLECSIADEKDQTLQHLKERLRTEAVLGWGHLTYGAAPQPRLKLAASAPKESTGLKTIELRPDIDKPTEADRYFNPARLRAALMGLTCALTRSLSPTDARKLAAGDGIGFSVRIEGLRDSRFNPAMPLKTIAPQSTGSVREPLVLSAFTHPILEEVFGELEYSTDQDGLYRRYVVSVQPVQPLEVGDMAAFLAGSVAETDPYGWAVLQKLGLAGTVKLFDRDLDRFLDAGELLRRIEPVLGAAVARYSAAYPVREGEQDVARCYGQPFVEVLLRPGQDRRSGPFDAVLATGGVELEPDDIDLADEALAIAQISLRPAPVAARRYLSLTLKWKKAWWPRELQPVDAATTRTLAGYEIEFTPSAAGDLLSLNDGAVVELRALETVRLPLRSFPKGRLSDAGAPPPLRYLLRATDQAAPPGAALVARVREVTMVPETPAVDGKPPVPAYTETKDTFRTMQQLLEIAVIPAPSDKPEQTPTLPSIGVEGVFEPAAGPTDTRVAAYERFAALSPETWSAVLTTTNPAAEALRSLRENLRYTAPALAWPGATWVEVPGESDVKQIAAAFVPWWQRFLDHAAVAGEATGAIHFALAAPVRANPLQLAADARGRLSLSFLHADRWAHARVYAVRPTPRYQNLAVGAGYYADQGESEQLVTAGLLEPGAPGNLRNDLGYALAVSPRTERIEPPVILGSQLTAQDKPEWELVVARHGEEALSFSNRSLFARLGTEGTALSFIREYRDPSWPQELRKLFEEAATDVAYTLYPERTAQLAAAPDNTVGVIDATDLARLSGQYPSLWKGADIWRIGQLPAHYRVSALAVARAGLVVSRVVSAVQDATPRWPLSAAVAYDGAAVLGDPALSITRVGDQAASIHVVDLRLVSHADLSHPDSHDWFTGGVDDIAWWPDPNVRYTVVRRGRLGEGRAFEDEDAEVSLITEALGKQPQTSFDAVAINFRGTRFTAPAGPLHRRVGVKPAVQGGHRTFHLRFELALAAGAEQILRLSGVSEGTDAQIDSFNGRADNFARIRRQVVIQCLAEGPTADAELREWLRVRASELRTHVATVRALHKPKLEPALAALDALADSFDKEANGTPPPNSSKITYAETVLMEREDIALIYSGAPLPLAASWGELLLLLRDLPTEDEAVDTLGSGHPAAAKGGKLWQACSERLLGGGDVMKIRAVDTRNALQKNVQDATWSAPGETLSTLTLPAWTGWKA